jgi:hypothetical protein
VRRRALDLAVHRLRHQAAFRRAYPILTPRTYLLAPRQNGRHCTAIGEDTE